MNIDEESPRRHPPLPIGTSHTRELAFSAEANVARGHLCGCMSTGDKWRRAERIDHSSRSVSKQPPLLNLSEFVGKSMNYFKTGVSNN